MSRQALPTPARPQVAAAAPPATRARRLAPLRVAWLLLLLTVLLAALLLFVRRATLDEQALTTFEAAASLYAGGDPALAQQAYAQLASQGAGGVALLHNWGAAALRAGDLTTAVAALEQAQQMAPRDQALAAALETARAIQVQSSGAAAVEPAPAPDAAPETLPAASPAALPTPAPESAPPQGLAALLAPIRAQWLAPNELALVALGLWVAFCALLLVALAPTSRRRSRPLRVGALAVAIPVALGLAIALAALVVGG